MSITKSCQTRCVNCNYIYFVKYANNNRFCNLDCKSTFEYKNNITEFVANNIIQEESLNDLIPLSLIMSDVDSSSYIKEITKSLTFNEKKNKIMINRFKQSL